MKAIVNRPKTKRLLKSVKVKPADLNDNPARFVNDVIRSLGLKTRRGQARSKDGSRRRLSTYRLAPDECRWTIERSLRTARRAFGLPVPPIEKIDPAQGQRLAKRLAHFYPRPKNGGKK